MSSRIFFSDEQKRSASTVTAGKKKGGNATKAVKAQTARAGKAAPTKQTQVSAAAPKKVTRSVVPVANGKGTSSTKPAKASKKDKLQHALQTARAIVSAKTHFNHENVKTLLRSHEMGWTDADKFVEALPKLLI